MSAYCVRTTGAAMPLQAGRQSSQTPLTQINNINVKFMTRSGHYSHNVRSSLKNKLCCSAKPVRKCCSRVSIAGHPFPASSKLSLPRSHSANLAVQSISTEIAGAGSNACDALAQQLISESLSGTVRISSTFTSCIQEVSHLLHKQSHFYFIGRKPTGKPARVARSVDVGRRFLQFERPVYCR